MANIMIDTEVLARCAANLMSRSDELSTLNEQLRTLVGNIAATWVGRGGASYANMMWRSALTAAKFNEVLKQYQEYVAQTRQRFEEADSQCAARIRGSF